MVYYDVKPLGDLIKEFYELHKGSGYLDPSLASGGGTVYRHAHHRPFH